MTTPARRKPNLFLSVVLPVMFLIGFVFMGADVVYLNLRPLQYLGVRFAALFSYAHWLAPAVAVVIWLSLRWRFPYLSALVAFLLCGFMLNGVVWYAESRLDRVATTRFLTPEEQETVKAHLTFPFYMHAMTGRGNEILIEKSPSHVQQLTEELRRLDVLRPIEHKAPATLPKESDELQRPTEPAAASAPATAVAPPYTDEEAMAKLRTMLRAEREYQNGPMETLIPYDRLLLGNPANFQDLKDRPKSGPPTADKKSEQ